MTLKAIIIGALVSAASTAVVSAETVCDISRFVSAEAFAETINQGVEMDVRCHVGSKIAPRGFHPMFTVADVFGDSDIASLVSKVSLLLSFYGDSMREETKPTRMAMTPQYGEFVGAEWGIIPTLSFVFPRSPGLWQDFEKFGYTLDDQPGPDQIAALHASASIGSYTTLLWLLEQGADACVIDAKDRTMLDHAIEAQRRDEHAFTEEQMNFLQSAVAHCGTS